MRNVYTTLNTRLPVTVHKALLRIAKKHTEGNITRATELCVRCAEVLLVENPTNPLSQQILKTNHVESQQ